MINDRGMMINDRGMMKYQGFFMTEHSELLKEAIRDYYKVEKPRISQDQIEEFERVISDSLQLNTELEITIWKDGFFETELSRSKKSTHLIKGSIFKIKKGERTFNSMT
ncbi:YolD-like family protein (plasmid) [Pseudalkalibacillus hwajinpoensis]